ncbi:hypothetical protein KSP40_PGU011565 [Platanthera guangdongensis]|uniref:ARM repeat superfamily protein n=1 Tax=Platanthera guangdongensis TaxID=2320717 RepID=A0ABR2LWD2_9ASPA
MLDIPTYVLSPVSSVDWHRRLDHVPLPILENTLPYFHFSSFDCESFIYDDIALEEEVERKVGWLLKAFFIVTALAVAANFFPYMGDSLLRQSIALLHVKDPLFKRMGASRLRRFAVDDERRMRVVEMGGAQYLLEMLEGARDDKTRKEALKALLALSHSDAVAEVLRQSGAAVLVASVPDSLEFHEICNCKSSLLERFREPEHNPSPSLVRPTP